MKWPNDKVSEAGRTFPDGPYTVKVVSQTDTEARNGQAQISVETRILKPSQFRNQSLNFNFTIGVTAETAAKLGIEEDLAAEREETWTANPSARRYKSFLKACGVPDTGDSEEEASFTTGKMIVIDLGHHESGGRTYNDANAFYSEQESAATPQPSANGSAKGAAAATVAGRPKAAAVRPQPKAETPAAAEDGWE